MVTQNFINFSKALLFSYADNSLAAVPITDTSNNTKYVCPTKSRYPGAITVGYTTSSTGTGIMFGTGTTPATLTDYKLESQITSGISAAYSGNASVDSDGNLHKSAFYTITNTSSDDITISEIGYAERLSGSSTIGDSGISSTSISCLFDRTLLTNPITIPAGEAGVIKYDIKTIIE